MAISVLDVRDTFATPRLPLQPRPAGTGTSAPRRPLSALAAGGIAVIEAVALLAVALQSLDGLLTSPSRPSGPVVALALLGLAAWIVLAAGSGATLIDGTGRRMLVGVSIAELCLVLLVGVVAVSAPLPLPAALPLPGLLLLAAAVPVGKLLLAGSTSVTAWVAAAPRAVERRPDPVTGHRLLATATLGVIGLALGAVALLTPVEAAAGAGDTVSTVVYQP
ncbi:hypothetical protein [Blastococcus sp. CCUG 61487]|uniref:hypothetical protein n=1 Tax=Blastococcus sp. CCUG 61487 TaxID=1840703 RepID=UPI0010C0271A|nr:hypothetical protein [Blastococcus sp. CCUG 61487]TKJ18775.1 hypothetical protein A6V29_10855 [Blastococcus sp. CCUG 61487]